MNGEKETLTIREAAAFLGAHPQTVRKLARRGGIPAFKVGQDWRFRKDALERWVDTHHARSRKPRVLVVDDEGAMREVTRRVLESEGYDVATAADGAEALNRMLGEAPSVVLLDLEMPVMDGPTTLKAIREAHGDVPVIIITGYPDSDLMSRSLEYGPLLVLAKPFRKQQLLEGILTALRVPSRAGEGRNTTGYGARREEPVGCPQ